MARYREPDESKIEHWIGFCDYMAEGQASPPLRQFFHKVGDYLECPAPHILSDLGRQFRGLGIDDYIRATEIINHLDKNLKLVQTTTYSYSLKTVIA